MVFVSGNAGTLNTYHYYDSLYLLCLTPIGDVFVTLTRL